MSKREQARAEAAFMRGDTGVDGAATEEKQDEVIRESARAPRKEAAKEFLDEQEEQAGETSARRETRDEA